MVSEDTTQRRAALCPETRIVVLACCACVPWYLLVARATVGPCSDTYVQHRWLWYGGSVGCVDLSCARLVLE